MKRGGHSEAFKDLRTSSSQSLVTEVKTYAGFAPRDTSHAAGYNAPERYIRSMPTIYQSSLEMRARACEGLWEGL